MSWHDIVGHDEVVEQFKTAVSRGRLASTFLFVGPLGIGKRTLALKLSQALLCETNPEHALDPCGHCPSCQQVAALTHPDMEVVCKPPDKNFIPVDLFIGDREHRRREGLCHNISLKPFRGGRKIAIIDDADYLNQEGANCLLKTLEEPPPKSLLILIGESEQKQLPTIRSRSQVVRFRALTNAQVRQLLLQHSLVEDERLAEELSELSYGSLARAMELVDEETRQFRESLFQQLASAVWDPVDFPKSVGAFIDEAGKEAPKRRARFRLVIKFAMEFYEQVLRTLSGVPTPADPALSAAANRAAAAGIWDESAIARRLDRCIDAELQLAANANQATLLDCWLDDLSLLAAR